MKKADVGIAMYLLAAIIFFIIPISFLLEYTVNFIVFDIINIETITKITNNIPVPIRIPLVKFISFSIVSLLLSTLSTCSIFLISFCTSSFKFKSVNVTI